MFFSRKVEHRLERSVEIGKDRSRLWVSSRVVECVQLPAQIAQIDARVAFDRREEHAWQLAGELLDERRLADAPAPVDDGKLEPARLVKPLQNTQLPLTPYEHANPPRLTSH